MRQIGTWQWCLLATAISRLRILNVVVLAWIAAATNSTPHAQTCVEPPNDAVAWWSFDELTGPVASDAFGMSPGAYTNGAAPGVGWVNGAAGFDGSNDFISVPDSPLWDLGSMDFTIEFWARFSSPGSGSVGHPGDIFVGNDEGPGGQEKWFFALGGGVLNFHINGPSTGSSFSPQVPFSPTVGKWYHLAVTRQGNLFSIYVDGVLGGSSVVNKTIPNANAPLTIGQAESLGFMNGWLDEMSIYHRSLAAEELAAIFAAGASGKCLETTIVPNEGGNDGTVTVTVTGPGLNGGSSVSLTHPTHPSVEAEQVVLQPNGKSVRATFDLKGAEIGVRDVLLDNGPGAVLVLPQAFEVVAGTGGDLWSDITGYNLILAGGEQSFWLTFGNDGNTDVHGAMVLLRIPADVEYKFGADDPFVSSPEEVYEGVLVPHLAANETRFVSFRIRAPFGGAIMLGTAIAESPADMYDAEPNYHAAVAVQSSDFSGPAAASGDLQSFSYGGDLNSGPSTGALAAPVSLVAYPSGDPGGPGAVHWFTIAKTYPDGSTHNEQQVGVIGPDGQIMWSLSGMQVQKNGFSKTGSYFVGNVMYEWSHLYGFDPFPPSQMQAYVDGLDDVFDALAGTPHSFNGAQPGTISCLGFLLKALWPGGPPADFVAEPGGDCPTDACWTTSSLLTYLLSQFGLSKEELIGLVDPPSPFQSFLDWLLAIIGSWDPNVKGGSQGAGDAHFVGLDLPLRYTILFENDPDMATAAAHKVVIEDVLDPGLVDLSTLSLDSVGFGDVVFSAPSGSKSLSADLPIPDVTDRIVRVTAVLNPTTAELSWTFQTIDLSTGLPPLDPLAGFLPPNVTPPEGEGAVVFTIQPRAELSTGTLVPNEASIFFDFNDPIITPLWTNTVDVDPPTSEVDPLVPIQTTSEFLVSWTGVDSGSGVDSYDITVSVDGAPFEPWLVETMNSEALYQGQSGHAYAFRSLARDLVGNEQESPSRAVSTVVDACRLVDFESDDSGPLSNGAVPIFSDDFVLQTFGVHYGAAVFDSDPLGPNSMGADPDLLVDLGNVLILQGNPMQSTPGIFDTPDDAEGGGELRFDFVVPVSPRSVDLIDLSPDSGQFAVVRLTDVNGRSRSYFIPAGWTTDVSVEGAGFRTLDLKTVKPQAGAAFAAIVTGERGFDLDRVVMLAFTFGGSGALDNLRYCVP